MRKAIIWETLGDLRCPCCGRYATIKSTGHRNKTVYQLTCKTTKETFVRPLEGFWLSVTDANSYIKERRLSHAN